MRLIFITAFLAASPSFAADRIGYIRYDDRPNLITEVRETIEAGRKVYVVVERPSGFIYRQDYAPDGTVWQKP